MFTAKDLKKVLEFIPEGKNKNLFNPEKKECYRQSDFDEDEEKSKKGFVLCAVVY